MRVNDLSRIYRHRFDAGELQAKDVLWSTLCADYFQQYVQPTDVVLDLGAGSCEFINNIAAGRKVAVDLNPDTGSHLRDGQFLQTASDDLSALGDQSVDVVFSSNFFEHLLDKKSLMTTLAEVRRVLRPGGRLIVLMPNARYLGGRYWDYLDHHIPLTHLSLVEALELSGLEVDRVVPRFLPYTVKGSRLPIRPTLIRLYLRLPIVWPFVGRQMLVVGHV